MEKIFAAFILVAGAFALNVAFFLITLLPTSNDIKFVLWISALVAICSVVVRETAKRIEF